MTDSYGPQSLEYLSLRKSLPTLALDSSLTQILPGHHAVQACARPGVTMAQSRQTQLGPQGAQRVEEASTKQLRRPAGCAGKMEGAAWSEPGEVALGRE